jgi:Chaperone of endosialidase
MRGLRISFKTSSGLVCVLLAMGTTLLGQQSNSGRATGEPAPASRAGAQATAVSQTVVPRLIKFSGILSDLSGKPVTGPVDVTFSLYAEQSGGAPLWLETQTVEADSLGRYNVLLGAMTPAGVPMELFTGGEARWLGVQVSNLPEQPRVLLVSVPYAMKAGDAETLGGRPASEYQLTPQAETSSRATRRSGETTTRESATGSSTSSKSQGVVRQTITATPNYIPVFTNSDGSMNNSVMYQNGTNLGIGTTSPSFGLDINANVIGVGATVPKSGFGGSLRFRDDTGTPRWLFGLLGSAGATTFNVSDMINHYQPFIVQAGAATNSLVLSSSGRVGIGTASPAAKLDVAGNFNIPRTPLGGASGVISLGGTPFLHACCGNSVVNTFLGLNAGNMNSTGDQNTGVGAAVLYNDTGGNYNTAFGAGAMEFNSSASRNTAVGYQALNSNSTTGYNTAVGSEALALNTFGGDNTAIGAEALSSSTAGAANTAVGYAAMAANSNGGGNTAIGYSALFFNSSGLYNTAIGESAGFSNKSGSKNTFLGFSTDANADNLTNATAVGAYAKVGASNSLVLGGTGTYAVNVGIGTETPSFPLTVSGTPNQVYAVFSEDGTDSADNLKFQVAPGGGTSSTRYGYILGRFGNGFKVANFSSSGALILGAGSAAERMRITASGKVGIGTTNPQFLLDVAGDVNFAGCVNYNGGGLGSCATPSDARLKTNIRSFPLVLDKLVELQPVHFDWNPSNPARYRYTSERNAGLIAQQVEKVFPDMVTTGNDGYKRVYYNELPYLLLEGIRELKARNDKLSIQVREQREQIAGLNRSAATKDAQIQLLNRKLAQFEMDRREVAAIESRLSRVEAQQKATRDKLARASRRQKKGADDELARVDF